ncbi:MAG: transglycosylase SLT domain-containing protein [Sideroxydans sp.]|nr:transglycosylase SLT domain-containing protein [Sideroxydans sp.]
MKYLLLLLCVFPVFSWADVDADFLAARDAFRAGNAARLDNLAPTLRKSALEPYLSYYQLRLNWENKSSAPIKAFLAREADSPIVDQLRVEWLKFLAKEQRWDEFAAEYPRVLNVDNDLLCSALQWQSNRDATGAMREARKLWLVGTAQPESCAPLFQAAIEQDIITRADVMMRVQLALEAGNTGLAKRLLPNLKDATPAWSVELDNAVRNPKLYLEKTEFSQATEWRRRVALFSFHRLAKQSPDIALTQWKRIASDFSDEDKKYFFAWLAFEAARGHDARAMEWYLAAGDDALTTTQLAWRARAALRALNWHEVWLSIVSMTPAQQNEGTWRYWKARALKELGRPADANALFVPLSREYNFYGQMAADELGIAPDAGITTGNFQPSNAELDAMESRPGIQRTLMLYRMGLRVEAAKEWDWALRGLSDRQLLVAAEVARRKEIYDRSINAAIRTVEMHDFNLRFPAPYREALQSPLREQELEEAWVYGLMRQESRFAQQAKSTVGAAGLMQIMPATAKWAARRLGIKGYRAGLIHELDVNLRLGTYYMKNVFSQLDDSPVLASAAYNAGPGRARKWRGNIPLEGAIYAETIPFDETRDYVKKVMSNTLYYSKIFGGSSASLKKRMGIIAAKNSQNQQAVPDEI